MAAAKQSLLLALAAASLLLALPTANAQACNDLLNPYLYNPNPPTDWYVTPLETTPPNDCFATTVSARFAYWAPPTVGNTITTTFASQPLSTAGQNLISTGQLGSPTITPASGTQTLLTCPNIQGAAGTTWANMTTLSSMSLATDTECCRNCAINYQCFAWSFNTAGTACTLYAMPSYWKGNNANLLTTAAAATVNKGLSPSWQIVTAAYSPLVPPLTLDLASISMGVSGTYTQACNGAGGVARTVGPSGAFINVTLPVIDSPSLNLTATTGTSNSCFNINTTTATFAYSFKLQASNVSTINAAAFTAVLDNSTSAANCTAVPVAYNLTSVPPFSNATSGNISVTCVAPANLAVGNHSITLTTVFQGNGSRCSRNTTQTATWPFTVVAPPSPPTLTPVAAPPVCSNAPPASLTAVFTYSGNNNGAATFAAAVDGAAAGCSVAPPTLPAGAPATNVTVTCNGSYAGGVRTIGVAASYSIPSCTGVAGSGNVTAATNVTLAYANSVNLTRVSVSRACTQTNAVTATFLYTATAVGTTTLTTDPGCVANVTNLPTTGFTTVATPVTVTCISNFTTGAYPVNLYASYNGITPCAGGSINATATAVVDPQPSASLVAQPAPEQVCPLPPSITVKFNYSSVNTATTTFSADVRNANLFLVPTSCTVNPPSITGAAQQEVTVVCTATSGEFAAGLHTVHLNATFSPDAASACTGGVARSSVTVDVPSVGQGTSLVALPPQFACAGPNQKITTQWNYTASPFTANAAFTATLDGSLSCTVTPSFSSVSTLITAVCPSSSNVLLTPGVRQVFLNGVFQARAPCSTNSQRTAVVNVTVITTGNVTITAPSPATTCYAAKTISATFTVRPANLAAGSTVTFTGANTADPTATCTVAPSAIAADAAPTPVTVTCTNDAGFASGAQSLALTGAFTGVSPCAGAGNTTATATVTVSQPPTITVRQRPASSTCQGGKNVTLTFTYNVTGAGVSPIISLAVLAAPENTTCVANTPTASGTTGNFTVSCFNPNGFVAPAVSVDVTVRATVTAAAGCGTSSAIANGSVPLTCCSTISATAFPIPDAANTTGAAANSWCLPWDNSFPGTCTQRSWAVRNGGAGKIRVLSPTTQCSSSGAAVSTYNLVCSTVASPVGSQSVWQFTVVSPKGASIDNNGMGFWWWSCKDPTLTGNACGSRYAVTKYTQTPLRPVLDRTSSAVTDTLRWNFTTSSAPCGCGGNFYWSVKQTGLFGGC